ncbi:MAG: competence type IV pilus assembly protein ComGB [Ectobacillus sp.]
MFFYKKSAGCWKVREQIDLLRRLGNLLEKGYSLWHALEFLQFYLNEGQKKQLRQAVEELKKGNSLHLIFSRLSFHPDVLAYLFYAEKHGDISFALQQGSRLLERKDKHVQKIKKALYYPLFLLFFLMIMVFLFNTILIPQFSSLYRSLPASSSLPQFIARFLQVLPAVFWGAVCFFFVGAAVYMFYFKKLHPVRQMNAVLKVPFIKKLYRAFNSHYFAVQLSSLLLGGLSIREAFLLMEQQRHHPFFHWEAKEIQRRLANGDTLESILNKRPYYEQELSYVIKHGQASGNVANELVDYGEMIVERAEMMINRLILVIQPIIFAIIGIIVVLMYLAMLLPMFNMLNSM